MVVTVLLACVSLWLLSTVKRLLEAWYAHVSGFSDHAIAWAMIPIAAATAFSITFYKTQYSDFLPLMRISLRSSAVGLLVYLLVEPPDFTTAFEHAAVIPVAGRVLHLIHEAAGREHFRTRDVNARHPLHARHGGLSRPVRHSRSRNRAAHARLFLLTRTADG